MTKLSVQKTFDTSKVLQTDSGRELADFIQYVSQFTEQVIRALTNGIGVSDNLNSEILRVSIESGTVQTINPSGSPIGIVPIRVLEPDGRVSSNNWFFNEEGEVQLLTLLFGLPAGTPYTVDYLVIYS